MIRRLTFFKSSEFLDLVKTKVTIAFIKGIIIHGVFFLMKWKSAKKLHASFLFINIRDKRVLI
jgi:hypothetical protein